MPKDLKKTLGSRFWRNRALSRSKVDVFAPHTHHVNLRIVGQFDTDRAKGVPRLQETASPLGPT